jgi:hypothetical protein
MADQVHLVIGDCGEYSDQQTWTVCGYPEEKDANDHAAAANKAAAELREKWEAALWGDTDAEPLTSKNNPYDPHEVVTCYEIKYRVQAVELRRGFTP